jgi:1-acyl-sn-glycerol-3-phosphate acyltransferase
MRSIVMTAIAIRQRQPRPEHWWQGRPSRLVRDVLQRAGLFPVLRVLCRRFRVEGVEHVEGLRGPAIFVANHSSHFDTCLVVKALPVETRRRLTVAAAADYFYRSKAKASFVSLLLNTFPFDRERGEESLALCERSLRDGWSLLIFPEGTRSTTGEVGRFKRGVGLLAARTGAPVVALHIEGASELMPKGRSIPRRTDVMVRIGAPLAFGRGEDAAVIADELRGRVIALASVEG